MTKIKLTAGALALLALTLAGCGDGQRHYSGGHETPFWYEVFSHEDPIGEIRGIFLYMILPVAVGTLLSLAVSYFFKNKPGSRPQLLWLLPRSIMCGVILSSIAGVFCLTLLPVFIPVALLILRC